MPFGSVNLCARYMLYLVALVRAFDNNYGKDASSIDLSICKSVEAPDSIDTDMFLNINAASKIYGVPVRIINPVLNALIYPMPSTVPGMANVRSEEICIIFLPGNRLRVVKYAIYIPNIPVKGAAISESYIDFPSASFAYVHAYLKWLKQNV